MRRSAGPITSIAGYSSQWREATLAPPQSFYRVNMSVESSLCVRAFFEKFRFFLFYILQIIFPIKFRKRFRKCFNDGLSNNNRFNNFEFDLLNERRRIESPFSVRLLRCSLFVLLNCLNIFRLDCFFESSKYFVTLKYIGYSILVHCYKCASSYVYGEL